MYLSLSKSYSYSATPLGLISLAVATSCRVEVAVNLESVDTSPISAFVGCIGSPKKGEKKLTVDVAIQASPKTLIFNSYLTSSEYTAESGVDHIQQRPDAEELTSWSRLAALLGNAPFQKC
jgi:hypothetical protein